MFGGVGGITTGALECNPILGRQCAVSVCLCSAAFKFLSTQIPPWLSHQQLASLGTHIPNTLATHSYFVARDDTAQYMSCRARNATHTHTHKNNRTNARNVRCPMPPQTRAGLWVASGRLIHTKPKTDPIRLESVLSLSMSAGAAQPSTHRVDWSVE